jgi:DNA topoisomerase-1
MPYTLIITEKPAAAKKIADALADGKAINAGEKGVPQYKVTHNKEDIVVACAVGHLYGLAEKVKRSGTFPVFDIEWKPVFETSKSSAFTKKYLDAIKKLAKDAKDVVVATDYDVEGEVIGLNIVRYVCKRKDAFRMKFSTLTKDELVDAFKQKSKHLDWGQAKAGETRHYLDWYNGINYSRALTNAIKTTGSFKLMSTGRVQGPALKIIVDREKEIQKFVPVPYWEISLEGDAQGSSLEAWHEKDKFWDREEAEHVLAKTKGQNSARVSSVERKDFKQQPPFPFDLTTLQVEAYRALGIQPKYTLDIAQNLYVGGYISYPRTSSQKLPPSIGYRKILSALGRNPDYAALAEKLLSLKTLEPHDGEKTDPAHPAIFPTGVQPEFEDKREQKVYDLVVKRFLATFSTPAVRETMSISVDCSGETFIAKGTHTVERGWHSFYAPYVDLEEQELPKLVAHNIVAVKKVEMHHKETQPPKRYTPASIIKELEKRNLGTKATRSEIVDTLFRRGYVDGRSIEATELGIRTVGTLEKHAPKIVDEELTRHFEDEMEDIREGKREPSDVLEEAREALTKILHDFKKEEKEVGKELLDAHIETRNELTGVGKCMVCKEGDLQIRKGRFGMFVACNTYPGCKTTFSLPRNALIKPAKKNCAECGYPMVLAIRKKGAQEFCLNKECESKHVEGEAGKHAKAIAKGEIKKKCPVCGEGQVVLRKSIYGAFYGCSKYPECKYIEQLKSKEKKDELKRDPDE